MLAIELPSKRRVARGDAPLTTKAMYADARIYRISAAR